MEWASFPEGFGSLVAYCVDAAKPDVTIYDSCFGNFRLPCPGASGDSAIAHVEALSPTDILVLCERGGHRLFSRVVRHQEERNAEVGYAYTKPAHCWVASVCTLATGAGTDSVTAGANVRSYFTAKYLPSKRLLAVLSSDGSQGRCDVFAVVDNTAPAAAATPLATTVTTFSSVDSRAGGGSSSRTTSRAAPLSFQLASSVSQYTLPTGDGNGGEGSGEGTGGGTGGVQAFWHTVAQPQWDFVHLVAFSRRQCSVVMIPGNVLRATGSDVRAIMVSPLAIPGPRPCTIAAATRTQSYRKGELCILVQTLGASTTAATTTTAYLYCLQESALLRGGGRAEPMRFSWAMPRGKLVAFSKIARETPVDTARDPSASSGNGASSTASSAAPSAASSPRRDTAGADVTVLGSDGGVAHGSSAAAAAAVNEMLEQLSPRAAAEAEARANPVIFENDVHYRETFPFWSRRKLVVRKTTIDVFHAPGSDKNLSLPLDKVVVLRLGNNALQHEVTVFVEEAYTPTKSFLDTIVGSLDNYGPPPPQTEIRDYAIKFHSASEAQLVFEKITAQIIICRHALQSSNFLDVTEKQRSEMDNAFLRFSVGLSLVFRQFRAQPRAAQGHKRQLHHSALHPHKGLGGAGGGGAGDSAGKPPRASLIMDSSDGGPGAVGGGGSGGERGGGGGERGGGGGRGKPRDFLNVYYLDAALCGAGGPADGVVGGAAAVAQRERLRQLSATASGGEGGGGGDDACVLHQRFNFTFAEKFGNANCSLKAPVTRIDLPATQGRLAWRPDLAWSPVVRSPLLLQIDGGAAASAAAAGRPQQHHHHLGCGGLSAGPGAAPMLRFRRLCFYAAAAAADSEANALAAQKEEAVIHREAAEAADAVVHARTAAAAAGGGGGGDGDDGDGDADVGADDDGANLSVVEQLRRRAGVGTLWRTVVPKAHVRDQVGGKETRDLAPGEVIEQAQSRVSPDGRLWIGFHDPLEIAGSSRSLRWTVAMDRRQLDRPKLEVVEIDTTQLHAQALARATAAASLARRRYRRCAVDRAGPACTLLETFSMRAGLTGGGSGGGGGGAGRDAAQQVPGQVTRMHQRGLEWQFERTCLLVLHERDAVADPAGAAAAGTVAAAGSERAPGGSGGGAGMVADPDAQHFLPLRRCDVIARHRAARATTATAAAAVTSAATAVAVGREDSLAVAKAEAAAAAAEALAEATAETVEERRLRDLEALGLSGRQTLETVLRFGWAAALPAALWFSAAANFGDLDQLTNRGSYRNKPTTGGGSGGLAAAARLLVPHRPLPATALMLGGRLRVDPQRRSCALDLSAPTALAEPRPDGILLAARAGGAPAAAAILRQFAPGSDARGRMERLAAALRRALAAATAAADAAHRKSLRPPTVAAATTTTAGGGAAGRGGVGQGGGDGGGGGGAATTTTTTERAQDVRAAAAAAARARRAQLDFEVFWGCVRAAARLAGPAFADVRHAVPGGDRSWRLLFLDVLRHQLAADAVAAKTTAAAAAATAAGRSRAGGGRDVNHASSGSHAGARRGNSAPGGGRGWLDELLPGSVVADAFESGAQGYLVEKCLKHSEEAAAAATSAAAALAAASGASAQSAAAAARKAAVDAATDVHPWTGEAGGLRRAAFPLWVREVGDLRKVLDAVAKRQFARTRKVEDVAVYYAALGRKVALAQLYRTVEGDAVRAEFFGSDFSGAVMRAKAVKNAAFLHARRRFSLAAAIYLVMDPPDIYKALVSLGKGLDDPVLAMTVGRVAEAAWLNRQKAAAPSSSSFGGGVGGAMASSSAAVAVAGAGPRLGPQTRRFVASYLTPMFKRRGELLLAGAALWWTNALPVHRRLGGRNDVGPAGPREHFICEAATSPGIRDGAAGGAVVGGGGGGSAVAAEKPTAVEAAAAVAALVGGYVTQHVDRVIEAELLANGRPAVESSSGGSDDGGGVDGNDGNDGNDGGGHTDAGDGDNGAAPLNHLVRVLSTLAETMQVQSNVRRNQAAAALAARATAATAPAAAAGGMFGAFAAKPKPAARPAAAAATGGDMFASFGLKPKPAPAPATAPAPAAAASDMFASFGARPKPAPAPSLVPAPAAASDMFASFGAKPKPKPAPAPAAATASDLFASFSAKPKPNPASAPAPAAASDMFASFGAKPAPRPKPKPAANSMFAAFAHKPAGGGGTGGGGGNGDGGGAAVGASTAAALHSEKEDSVPPPPQHLFTTAYPAKCRLEAAGGDGGGDSGQPAAATAPSRLAAVVADFLQTTAATLYHADVAGGGAARGGRAVRGEVSTAAAQQLLRLAAPEAVDVFDASRSAGGDGWGSDDGDGGDGGDGDGRGYDLAKVTVDLLEHRWRGGAGGGNGGGSGSGSGNAAGGCCWRARFLPSAGLAVATAAHVSVAAYALAAHQHAADRAAASSAPTAPAGARSAEHADAIAVASARRRLMRGHLSKVCTFLQQQLLAGLTDARDAEHVASNNGGGSGGGGSGNSKAFTHMLLERNTMGRSPASQDNAAALCANVAALFHSKQLVAGFLNGDGGGGRSRGGGGFDAALIGHHARPFEVATFCLEQELLLAAALSLGYTEGLLSIVQRFCAACRADDKAPPTAAGTAAGARAAMAAGRLGSWDDCGDAIDKHSSEQPGGVSGNTMDDDGGNAAAGAHAAAAQAGGFEGTSEGSGGDAAEDAAATDADGVIWAALYHRLHSNGVASVSFAAAAAFEATVSARTPRTGAAAALQQQPLVAGTLDVVESGTDDDGADSSRSNSNNNDDDDNDDDDDSNTNRNSKASRNSTGSKDEPPLSMMRLRRMSLLKRSKSVDQWNVKWGKHVETQLVLTFLQYFGLATFVQSLRRVCAGQAVVRTSSHRHHHHGSGAEGSGDTASSSSSPSSPAPPPQSWPSLVTVADECAHALTFAYALAERLEAFCLSDLRRQIGLALARLEAGQREAQRQYAFSSGVGEIFQRLRTNYVRQVAMMPSYTQQQAATGKRHAFRAGGKRQRFEIEHTRIVKLLMQTGDAVDAESATCLVDIAVEKGMLCQLPKSTFYVLNDQAALEVSEDMGDFFESRFSRASPAERRRNIIEYFGNVAGCSGSMMRAWESIWLSNEASGEKSLIDAIGSAPIIAKDAAGAESDRGGGAGAGGGGGSAREEGREPEFLAPLQACVFDYLCRDDLLTRLGLDAAVLGILSVRIKWSHQATLVAARESSGVLFTAMVGRCSCPDSAMCSYPTSPCTHVTCSPKLVKGEVFLDWEFPPQRLQEVMNATRAHKKASVTMRIAAFHAKSFDFIDTIEFSMEPVSEQQEYSLTWAIEDRHVKLDVGIARNIVSSSTLNHHPWAAQ